MRLSATSRRSVKQKRMQIAGVRIPMLIIILVTVPGPEI
jgi:hypothetical protein